MVGMLRKDYLSNGAKLAPDQRQAAQDLLRKSLKGSQNDPTESI